MPSLIKCKVTDCGYNGGEICSKQDIYVSGDHAGKEEDTSCKSFTNSGGAVNSAYGHAMSNSFGGGAFSNAVAPHTDIACSVSNCSYNTGRSCSKNEIVVDLLTTPGNCQSPDQTCCDSFQEK